MQAAAEDEIVLGSLVKASEGTYYTYPNAEVKLADSTKAFHNLTITVDSGHIMTTATQIAGVTGQGVVSGADMNVGFTELTTTDRYESISFDFSAGAGKSDVETFVRQLRFTTSNKVQKVSVCATTEGTSATTEITVKGKTVELKYFNGHYYGFVPDRISWNEAYKISKN